MMASDLVIMDSDHEIMESQIDECEDCPRVALSSASPSERSEEITVNDSEDSSVYETTPKYEKVNEHYVYYEEIANKLLYNHFEGYDDDEISVSSIELDAFLTTNSWILSKRFKITFDIDYLPHMQYLSADFMGWFDLSLLLQACHLLFVIVWTFMACKFIPVDDEEATLAFVQYRSAVKYMYVYEACMNLLLPVMGFARHVNQKIRTLIIYHNLLVCMNFFHLVLLAGGSMLDTFVCWNFKDFAYDHMTMPSLLPYWENTQAIRQCCGCDTKEEWKLGQLIDEYFLPRSCCDTTYLTDNCTILNKHIWSQGCFSAWTDETVAIRIFSCSTTILLMLSLYHNVTAYKVLLIVRSLLKEYNHHLVYGTPKWLITREALDFHDYTLPLEEESTPPSSKHSDDEDFQSPSPPSSDEEMAAPPTSNYDDEEETSSDSGEEVETASDFDVEETLSLSNEDETGRKPDEKETRLKSDKEEMSSES